MERISNLEAENSELNTKLEKFTITIQVLSDELGKKCKQVKDIQDEFSQKKESVSSSQLGNNASNSSISSREGGEKVSPGWFYYPHLQTLDDIHQEAADITSACIGSLIPHSPKPCEEWSEGSLQRVQGQLEAVSWLAIQATLLVPCASETKQKMNDITFSLFDIYHGVKMKHCDSNPLDFTVLSSKFADLVENMMAITQTINFVEIPFQALAQFAEFLICFVRFCNPHSEVINRYEMRMRELILRSDRANH